MEKATLLPLPVEHQARQPTSKGIVRRCLSTALLLALTAYLAYALIADRFGHHDDRRHHHHHHGHPPNPSPKKHACAQPAPLFPSSGDEALDRAYAHLSTEAFRNGSIARHSGAVRIPTESFDDMGPIGEDKRWDTRFPFHDYLADTFPRIHAELKLEKVNTFGLLYTWEGSDESLKPLVLMAHQDVVPVPQSTVEAWTHGPWSGHFDGQFIWGRGSSDCKNQLIAEMEVVEHLLEAGFRPKRTVILSLGFDEEISGREGAGHLAPVLLERYGKHGVAAIVDEGAGFSTQWGQAFALPGVGEKGYTDVRITVRKDGGHSSIPTDHTGIGILSELITHVEAVQYPTYLAEESPYLGLLQCGARHAPDFPKKLKKLLGKHAAPATCHKKRGKKDELALEAAKAGRPIKYLMQTSQAVDVIDGGVKVNALPERTTVTINHRINIGDTPETVWDHLTALAKPIAEKYNLTLHAFTADKEAPNSISLSAGATTLRVAPVSPTDPSLDTPYGILAGTVRAVYGEEIVVAPGMMTGNTDTRYYWDVTEHIFRFGPGYDPQHDAGLGNIHTVDERISVDNHLVSLCADVSAAGGARWMLTAVRFVGHGQVVHALHPEHGCCEFEVGEVEVKDRPTGPVRGGAREKIRACWHEAGR